MRHPYSNWQRIHFTTSCAQRSLFAFLYDLSSSLIGGTAAKLGILL